MSLSLLSINTEPYDANRSLNYASSEHSQATISREEASKQTEKSSSSPYSLSTSMSRYSKTAAKIGIFLQQNWKTLLLYILIWSIIIICYGAMYGFETVGLPLAIGLGIGFCVGTISGLVVAFGIDKNNKWSGKNTLWSLMTHYMWNLDEYGTRQILLATIITIVSSAFTASPHATGVAIGILLGNHIITQICYHLKELPKPFSEQQKKLRDEKKRFTILKLINQLKIELLLKNQLTLEKKLLSLYKQRPHSFSIHASFKKKPKKTLRKRSITDHAKLTELQKKINNNTQKIAALSKELYKLNPEIDMHSLKQDISIS